MKTVPLEHAVRRIGSLLVALASLCLLFGCASHERSARRTHEAGAYRTVRASTLIGRAASDQRGQALGHVTDFVVQLGSGAVRYAVVAGHGMDRLVHAYPAKGMTLGDGGTVVLHLLGPRPADYPSWNAERWPSMQDIAYWDRLDRAAGYAPVEPDHGYDRCSRLVGRLVVDVKGVHVGRVQDLAIDAADDRVQYAIVALAAGPEGGGRLVAVPLDGFAFPREGTNRLALKIGSTRLAELPTFDAVRGQQLGNPGYDARVERDFAAALPAAHGDLFDRLDTNHDGFLSPAELAPLRLAGTDRYALYGRSDVKAAFRSLDRSGDGFLDEAEAAPILGSHPHATFLRHDINRDGFLSLAEATPLLRSAPSLQGDAKTFAELDTNHDGHLSRSEAAALLGQPVAQAHEASERADGTR